jgi:hypothetical protein
LNRKFSKQKVQIANKNKEISTSLAVKEMQIKNNIEVSPHPSKNGNHQEDKTTKLVRKWVCAGEETLVRYCWECKLVQPL